MPRPGFVLCSSSPRRRDLLAGLGLRFDVVVPAIDETPRPGEGAEGLALRLACEKAAAGAGMEREGVTAAGSVALAADTLVVVDGEILGKPRDRADAQRMLCALAGREHTVMTGLCVLGKSGHRAQTVATRVRFRPLADEQVRWLVDSGDGDDKAGAYAVQGLAGAFIERLEGSFTNVVGLPLAETIDLLRWAGLRLPWEGA